MVLFLIIFSDNFHQKNSGYLQQNLQKKYEENSQSFLKINQGNIAFKINGIAQNIFQKWRKKHKSLLNLEINYFKTHNKYSILSKNLRLLAQILSTMICAYLVIKNQISVGSIIAVSILLSKFLEPFSNFSSNLKSPKSLPYEVEFSLTSNNSRTPLSASQAASSKISPGSRETNEPRNAGIAQNVHLRSQPDAIFSGAQGVASSR